jgi:glycine betaine/proline transport system substrate-binding protein
MLSNFTMDDEQFSKLEDMVVNDFGEGQEQEAARAWLEENPEYADELSAYLEG